MESTQVSSNSCVDNEDVLCFAMEYYTVIRNNEIMQFDVTCMEQEDYMLSEVSQKYKPNDHS